MSQEGFRNERAPDGKDEWLTPPTLIKALGEFDLDPCAPVNRPWPTAANHLTTDDDGLLTPWIGRVWCNPPYGTQTGEWLRKLAAHGNGIALIFARTETANFFNYIWNRASGVLFLKGRIKFHHASGEVAVYNCGAPSCLVAYGARNAAVLENCSIPGKFVSL